MAAPADPTEPRFSVVIPTYQRRDLVVAAVRALAAQTGPSAEVVVVVDGSTDGTAAALRALEVDVPLTVVEQANAGRARAVNVGATRARGQVIMFLDDDMVAAPDLLEQHDRALAAGADAVIGHIPVAAETSAGFLARGLARWAEDRRDRLVANGGQLTVMDLITGQFSVRREVYEALGGLDERFTRSGSFGGEDIDFGRRLFDEGYRVEFAPEAVSWQHYVVGPRAYLRQWYQAGEADVVYTRKHPGDLDGVVAARRPAAGGTATWSGRRPGSRWWPRWSRWWRGGSPSRPPSGGPTTPGRSGCSSPCATSSTGAASGPPAASRPPAPSGSSATTPSATSAAPRGWSRTGCRPTSSVASSGCCAGRAGAS